jgi:hypothetical protein
MAQDWEELDTVAPTTLAEARLQAHHAAQWLARAARANLPPMPGDTETSLGWDAGERALFSHDLTVSGGKKARFGLALASMTLLFVLDGAEAERFAVNGRRDAELGAWMDRCAASAGLALPRGAALAYVIPMHPVGSGAAYAVSGREVEFAVLARWFAIAAEMLEAVRAPLAAQGATAVRCWPHHFDLATLWTVGEGDVATAPAIGIGLSPGDQHYAQPYFYVSPWPYPQAQALPSLPAGAHWHTEGFTGAILTADAVLRLKDRRSGTHEFLDAAVAAARQLLGKN